MYKPFSGAALCLLCPFNINFLSSFGGISQHYNPVGAHLEKATGNHQGKPLPTFPCPQFARLEHGHKWGMVRQDSQLTFHTRGNDRIHVL